MFDEEEIVNVPLSQKQPKKRDMIRYKTTTTRTIEVGRGLSAEKHVYLAIGRPDPTFQIVKPAGYYYYLNDAGQEVKLADFKGFFTTDQIKGIEDANLPDFTNCRNIIEALTERTIQFAMIKLDMEHAANNEDNWGINSGNIEAV